MEKFANALAETFMEKYPNVTVQAEFTGSSAGIESVLAGQCDVGDSSRALKDDEKAKGAVENIVAIDGIAVVVDPSNAVDGLSKDDLTGVYPAGYRDNQPQLKPQKNKFHNFEQRNTDYDGMVLERLKQRLGES